MRTKKILTIKLMLLLIFLLVAIFFAFLREKNSTAEGEKPAANGNGSKIEESLLEWWYFDGNLEDGTVFALTWGVNKISADGSLRYPIEVTILQPDGKTYSKRVEFPAKVVTAASQGCDLKFGENTLRGENGHYKIHLALEDLQLDFELKRNSSLYAEKFFNHCFGQDWRVGWLVEVPRGEIVGKMNLNGVEKEIRGRGYHDHNWFDLDLAEYGKLLDHRYWGRIFFDDYVLIFSYNITKNEYGPLFFESLYLSEGDQILVDYSKLTAKGEGESPALVLKRDEERTDRQTGIKVYDKLNLKYKDRNGIDLELDLKNLGDIHTLLPSAEMESQYTRYKAGAVLKIKRDGKEEVLESEGVAEFRD